MTRLSQIPVGLDWLAQFEDADKGIAKYMLDSLELVSSDLVRNTITAQIRQLSVSKPAALYAVTKRARGHPFFLDDGRAYNDVHRPRGSANLATTMIFELSREAPQLFLDHPPFKTLSQLSRFNLVLVDDACASGNRVAGMLRWLFENEKISSRLSSGHLDAHVIAYAVSDMAQEKATTALPGQGHPLRPRRSGRIFFHYERKIRYQAWAPGTPEMYLEQMRRVCIGYAKRHKLPRKRRLGYGDTMSHIVFEHSAPNNLPAIVNCTSKTWRPLFDDRSVSSVARAAFSLPSHDCATQQERRAVLEGVLGKPGQHDGRRISQFRLLLVAMLRYQRMQSLTHVLGISEGRVQEFIGLAQEHGLVESGRLTPHGRRLARAMLAKVAVEQGHDGLTEIDYMPRSFRAGQRQVQK